MIGYIVREVAGWLLIVLGLYVLFVSLQLLREGFILRAPPIALIGFIIFRGGIHLLKVAVAARTSLQARRDLLEAARRSRLPGPAAKSAPKR